MLARRTVNLAQRVQTRSFVRRSVPTKMGADHSVRHYSFLHFSSCLFVTERKKSFYVVFSVLTCEYSLTFSFFDINVRVSAIFSNSIFPFLPSFIVNVSAFSLQPRCSRTCLSKARASVLQ